MTEKSSLNNKYQKIDIEETPVEVNETEQKPKKEKKVKEPKPPKAKKEKKPKKEKVEKLPKEKKEKAPKEPKQPKEKKEKAPKEPKPPKAKKEKKPKKEKVEKLPKEKKEKTPKAPKEKKVKEFKFSKIKKEQKTLEIIEDVSAQPAEIPAIEISEEIPMEIVEAPIVEAVRVEISENGRRSEEYVLPVAKTKRKKLLKIKNGEKEKTLKSSKEKKEKKEKAPKEPKQPKEKKPREPLNKKDFATMGIAVLALVMIVAFAVIKYMPESEIETDFTETTTYAEDKLANVQVARKGVIMNLIQTDIPDVFYGFSSDYKLKYYQYKDNKMVAVQSTGSVNATVDMGNETIPITIDYVELGGKIFGAGLFVANNTENVYFYDMMAFQLVNLPEGYEQEGKALLLATTSKNALTQKITVWPESFVVDLETGKTSRFLKIINRSIDMTTGAGVEDFCILTNGGYKASKQIPFISAREYESGSGKQDIFIKNGDKESLYVDDVYGRFLLTDGDSLIFMRKTNKGFNVIRKTGEEEKVTATLFGSMSTTFIYSGDYIFNKNEGKLYNLKTGESKLIVGYRMSPEIISVSPDGKYLVMLGTVTNIMDYQVHIFNLETGEYSKFKDENYSNHSNLTFINDTTAVYMVLDPNQGYEYVVLDMNKVK